MRIALFAVLGLMVVALIYEYGFVRRAYSAAQEKIDNLQDSTQGDHTATPTPADVQATLGKAPLGGLQDKGDYYLEHYAWRRWLPWQTYSIYVIYRHTDPPQLFKNTRPDPPTANDLVGVESRPPFTSGNEAEFSLSSIEGGSTALPLSPGGDELPAIPPAEDESAEAGAREATNVQPSEQPNSSE